jgi:hypothetical protein
MKSKPRNLIFVLTLAILFFSVEAQAYPPVQVILPDTSGENGDTIVIPISVDDVTGKEIYSAEMLLTFDGSVLTADSAYTAGTIAQGWGPPVFNCAIGQISIAMAGISPLSGSGVLVYVVFIVNGSASDTTTIHFDQMLFNEGDPSSSPQDGLFTVEGPQPLIHVWIPDTSAQHGESICIPVGVGDVTGLEIYAAEVSLRFEAGVLSCDSATTVGTIAQGWGPPIVNCLNDTGMNIAMAGVSALADSGTLVYACFTVIGCPGNTTPLDLEIILNEGDPPDSCVDGVFIVDSIPRPTNCSATPSCDSITVTWIDNSGNEDGFYIHRDGALLDSVGPNESTYIDDNPDTIRHCYFITAFIIDCDESEASDSSCATVLGIPGIPTGVSTTPGSYIITISWTDVSNDTGYVIYRDSDTLGLLPADDTSCIDSSYFYDYSLFGRHCYSVSAINMCGGSDTSSMSVCDTLYLVKGNVRDKNGAPLEDSAVYVVSHSSRADLSCSDVSDSTCTDSLGDYWFKLPRGSFFIFRDSSVDKYDIALPDSAMGDSVAGLIFVGYYTDVKDLSEGRDLPDHYFLSQNYPNPFNPETNIEFSLPKNCHVKLVIYDILGRKVKTLLDENLSAGQKLISWDGKDENGRDVASGIYFYMIKAGTFSDTKKLVLLR